VYFVVSSTVLLGVVFYLSGCKIWFGGTCIGLVLKGVNRYDGQYFCPKHVEYFIETNLRNSASRWFLL
jgi:hypothetical protein